MVVAVKNQTAHSLRRDSLLYQNFQRILWAVRLVHSEPEIPKFELQDLQDILLVGGESRMAIGAAVTVADVVGSPLAAEGKKADEMEVVLEVKTASERWKAALGRNSGIQ